MGIRIVGNIPKITGVRHYGTTNAVVITAPPLPNIIGVANVTGTMNAGVSMTTSITGGFYSGNLPGTVTLANGVLSGNLPVVSNTTTYTSYFGNNTNVVQLNYTVNPDPYTANTVMLLSASHGTADLKGNFSMSAGAPLGVVANAAGAPPGQSSYFYITGNQSNTYSGEYYRGLVPSAYQFGSKDFTIEMFINPTSLEYISAESNYSACLMDIGDIGGNNTNCIMEMLVGYSGLSTRIDNIFFRGYTTSNSSAAWTVQASATGIIPMGQWSHIAFQRHGSVFSVMLNGTQVGTTSYSPALAWDSNQYINMLTYTYSGGAYSYPYNGAMNNVRITQGVCRYPGTTYTVPSAY